MKIINNEYFESQKNNFVLFLFLLILSLIVYSPSLLNMNFFWDDERFIFMNPTLIDAPSWMSFWQISSEHYKSWPLGYAYFWTILKIFPSTCFVILKIVNIFFHAINSFIIFKILKNLNFRFAVIPVIIFCIHPLNVETISWVFQALTILSFTFFSLSFYSFLLFKESTRWFYYFLSFAFFLFSIWIKSIATLAPFLFVFIMLFSQKKTKENFAKYFIIIPFLILGIYIGLINIRGVDSILSPNNDPSVNNNFITKLEFALENLTSSAITTKSKSKDVLGNLEVENRRKYFNYIYPSPVIKKEIPLLSKEIFTQGIPHYFSKLLIPFNLNFIYPQEKFSITNALLTLIIIGGLIFVTFFLYIKKKDYRLFFPLIISLIFLTQYLGITTITFFYWSHVSDRYCYYFLLAFVFFIALIIEFNPLNIKIKRGLNFFILFLISLNLFHGHKFNNPEIMYKEIIQYKKHPIIYSLLFEHYLLKIDEKNARKYLFEGLNIFPNDSQLINDKFRYDALEKMIKAL